jgi:4'-phosphopantetheinyl transferase
MLERVTHFVVDRNPNWSFRDDKNLPVWFTDLDQQRAEPIQLSWLSTSEHAKMARLKSSLDRRRYLASRIFTRRLLSNLTGIVPEDLEIITDKCGKPRLNLPTVVGRLSSEPLLGFNVSHSENFLGIAVALGVEVGIDIEVVNPDLDVLATSRACLDHLDVDKVRRASQNERRFVFYRLWTRREAFAKMQGHGVTSDHVRYNLAQPWSIGSFEFACGEKYVVGSMAIGALAPDATAYSKLPLESPVP